MLDSGFEIGVKVQIRTRRFRWIGCNSIAPGLAQLLSQPRIDGFAG
jgi:hypothetical protein